MRVAAAALFAGALAAGTPDRAPASPPPVDVPPAPEGVRVVLVGDSTMAPGSGYGDAFCGLFKWQVECVNLGRRGRSTGSYRTDGSWQRVAQLLSEGSQRATHVFLQFGHNDQPGKPGRSTDLATEFPRNLARYADEVRRANALPVFVTPLTRRMFDAGGTLKDDLAPWAEAMRSVAEREHVALLDLHAASVAAVSRMGPAEADTLAVAPPPSRDFDHTHLGPKGAALFARVLAAEMERKLPALALQLAVGAVEPSGRVSRPQLTAQEARDYSYAAVVGQWDPLADAAREPRGEPDYVVDRASAGSDGHFKSVQQAVSAAIARAKGEPRRVRIRIRPGTYDELVYIPESPSAITLEGSDGDPSAVRIRANLDATLTGERFAERFGDEFRDTPASIAAMFDAVRARPTVGTPGSAVAWIRNRGFEARNITFENAYNKEGGDATRHSQAVALMLDDADRALLENVRLIGFQDTFYLGASNAEHPARAFVHRSYIEGDMDFVFGEATAYFLETEIRSLGDRAVSYTLAPSTHYKSRHGFVFERCRFTHDGSANARAGAFKLARQWYRSPAAVGKVAILDSVIGAHIDAVRPWADWSIGTPRHRPVQYDSDEHWERLVKSGMDPVRELGYASRPSPPERFLAEYRNTTSGDRP